MCGLELNDSLAAAGKLHDGECGRRPRRGRRRPDVGNDGHEREESDESEDGGRQPALQLVGARVHG
jgi:hypothetical protein